MNIQQIYLKPSFELKAIVKTSSTLSREYPKFSTAPNSPEPCIYSTFKPLCVSTCRHVQVHNVVIPPGIFPYIGNKQYLLS